MNAKTVFIVGPTGSGKSTAAMKLAQEFNGEIICADSQTIRKGLDIGTAKPTAHDQASVPHHLLDAIEPYERFSVAQFKLLAQKALHSIRQKGKLPLVVGGTGLYIDALYYDYSLDEHQDVKKRQAYESASVDELQNIIKQNNWELPRNSTNPRHLIGVIMRQGASPADNEPLLNSLLLGILPSDDELRKRVDERIEHMFTIGLIDEVQRIVKTYGEPPDKLDAIGYPIVYKYIKSELTLAETKEALKRAHWQYARRQKMWFKRNKSIQWFGSAEALIWDARKQLASD